MSQVFIIREDNMRISVALHAMASFGLSALLFLATASFLVAQGPTATLSATSLYYFSVNHLSSGVLGIAPVPPFSLSVTLTNTGPVTLQINEISVVALPMGYPDVWLSQWSQSNTCGASLPPEASCTITASYATFLGNNYAFLQITDNAADSPQVIQLSPGGPAFNERRIFTPSAPLPITIVNDTQQSASISGLASQSPEFSPATDCPGTLASGASCTVNVTYTPLIVGYTSSAVNLTINGSSIAFPVSGRSFTSEPVVIANLLSKKVLDVTGASVKDGAPIQQWAWNGLGQQQWNLVSNPAPLGSEEADTFTIVSIASGKVLDVPGGSQANGTALQQWSANGSSQQKWVFEEASNADCSQCHLIQPWSDKAASGLDVTDGSTENGAGIQQWQIDYFDQQLWYLLPVQGATIINRLSGKALDATDASTENGTMIQQWTADGLGQQKWAFVPMAKYRSGIPTYTIFNTKTGKVLDVTSASYKNGTVIQQWDSNGSTQQQWQLVPTGDGYFKIMNVLTGKLLDVTDASAKDGALIQQWADDGGWQQLWSIVP